MLPAVPLSQLSDMEILESIRASRAKRVAVKAPVSKPRAVRKSSAAENLLEQINAMIAEDNKSAQA